MDIFVDLDGTLFDTQKLGADTAALLESELGIDPDDYKAAHQEMFSMNGGVYSAELHARRLAKRTGADEAMLVGRFINLFDNEDSSKYVYPDSVEFLNEARKLGKVVILTYGEAFVQTPRARRSGLRSLVSDVIVTQHDKAEAITRYFEPANPDGKKIVLIDDSLEHLDAVKARFRDATTIHIARNPQSQTTSEHRRASSLLGALEILT